MTRLSPASLERALGILLAEGDTDIFPPAFEYRAIKHHWSVMESFLTKVDLETWPVRPHRTALSPKGRLGFRVATQLDPLDSLLYTAMVLELGADIEAARQPESVVLSYRFEPDRAAHRLHKTQPGFGTFRQESLSRAPAGGFVLMTDVADFFPRLYLHRIENALAKVAGSNLAIAKAAARFVKEWNHSVSYGIPVGPAASRLIAECTLCDIDELLVAEKADFIRFSDDFRFFVEDEQSALAILSKLAESLHESQGLTLNEAKTRLVPSDEFKTRFKRGEEDEEDEELVAGFEDLAVKLGISEYELPAFEDLEEEDQERVEALNVMNMLERRLHAGGGVDLGMVRFLLRRMADLGLPDENDIVLGALDTLRPLFGEAIQALQAQHGLDDGDRHALGDRLLELLEQPARASLDYYAAWVFRTFSEDPGWNHRDRLVRLVPKYGRGMGATELIGALSTQGADAWFRKERRRFSSMDPWERRAFLSGVACLGKDERDAFYRSVKKAIDPLEKAIIQWVNDGKPS